MSGKLNKKCPNCGEDDWWSIDNEKEFIEVCSKCSNRIIYDKSKFINKFKCDKCSSTNGMFSDNDTNITFICRKCNTPKIVFEKHYVEEDNRTKIETGIILDNHQTSKSNAIKCPRCSSTQITTSKRGFSLMTGFIGANKTINRCARCGHTWKPKF